MKNAVYYSRANYARIVPTGSPHRQVFIITAIITSPYHTASNMKLHLPKQLFTALLSSIAMLSPWAVTLASGGLVFAASVAMGADQQLLESVTWDGTNTTTATSDGKIEVGEENADRDITLTIADGAQIEADWMLLRRGGDVMMTGGQVTLNKLHIHNYNQGGQTEEFVISGGVLTVQNENDFTATATGNRAPVTIGHWSNGGGKLVVSGGKLQVLNGSIYMGHDSYATLQISAGEANVAGLYYNTQQVGSSLELTGGRLNIGSEGISNTTYADERKVSLTGGTLGALDSWTLSGVTTTIGTVTIDTDKWDAATGATAVGEDVGVDISLQGNLAAAEGGMAITLAGSGSLTIDHTLNGTVTLKEGSSARLIADITNLAENYTKAYSGIGSTGASGFWLGYNILASGSNVTAYDTEGNNLNLTNGVYGVASDGIFYVNDEVTYDAVTMAAASQFNISNEGVLNMDISAGEAELVLPKSVSSTGTLNIAAGAKTVNLSSLFTAANDINEGHALTQNADAVVSITTTGAVSAGSANLSSPGTVQINNAASFTNNSKKLSGGKLVLSGVASATISGDRTLSANLELINTSLTLGSGDVVNYDNTGNLLIKVGAGSSIELGENRQSLRSNHVIEMAGGRISGTGSVSENCLLGLDFYSGGRVNTTADSTIATNVGGHLSGSVVFDVSDRMTLTMTGTLVSKGTYEKANSGTMLYKGGVFTRSMAVSGGVFEYFTESDITHTAAITGNGTLRKSGSGTLTLSNATVANLNVATGKLIYQLADNAENAVDHTLALTMGSGASFEKTGEGTLNVGTLENAEFGAGIVVSQGVLQYTGKSTEIAKNAPEFIKLLQNVSTTGTGKVQIAGDAKFNWTTQGNPVRKVVVGSKVNVTGNLEINTYDSGADADGENKARWEVQEGGLLDVGGKFWLTNKQKLVVDGGAVIAGSMHLGHEQNNATNGLCSKVVLADGSITTGNFTFIGAGNAVTMTGGALTFTPGTDGAEVLVTGNTSGAGTISFSGGKLAATTSGWSMTGTSNLRLSLGDVTLDIAAGKTVTLGGSYDLTGTLSLIGNTVEVDGATSTGTLTLTGTMNITSLQNLKQAEGQYTGGSDSRNGFSGYYYLVQNTDSASLSTSNLTVTLGEASNVVTERVSVVDNHLVISGSNGIFYVNAGSESATDSTMATEGFVRYHVEEDANLVISSGDTLASGNAAVVLTSTTGTGTLILGTDVTISGSDNGTVFEGTLKLDGAELTGDTYRTLTVGGDSTLANSVASLKEIVLAGQSKIQIKSNPTSETDIQKLTVAENGKGQLYIEDTHGAAMVIGEVQLKSGSGFTLDGKWQDSAITIGKLSGSGSFTYVSPSTSRQRVTIDSLLDFTGGLVLDNSKAHSGYSAVINTGTGSAVDFGSLVAKGSGTVLNVQTNTTVDTIDAAGGTVNLSAGTTLTLGGETASTSTIGTLTADAAGNTIHLNSTATLSRLANVSGGAITLTGSGTYNYGAYTTDDSFAPGFTLDADNWTGTVALTTGGSSIQLTYLADASTANSKLMLTGFKGYLDGTDSTMSNNLILVNGADGYGLLLDNGSYNQSPEVHFTGSIEGTGNLVYAWKNTHTNNPKVTHVISGDTSAWEGKFVRDLTHGSGSGEGKDVEVKFTAGGDVFADTDTSGVEDERQTGKLSVVIEEASVDGVLQGTNFRGSITDVGSVEVKSNTDFHRNVTTGTATVVSDKTAGFYSTLTADTVTNNGTLKLGKVVTNGAEQEKQVVATISGGTMETVQMSSTGIDSSTEGTKGTISNADIEIAQLAQEATFTIEDMTLTNSKITAASVSNVRFDNVTVEGHTVLKMQAAMQKTSTVGMGGTVVSFETSSYSGITLNTAAANTLAVDLGDLSCVVPMGPDAEYKLSITLNGLQFSDYETMAEGSGLLFTQDSWLGKLLMAQGATQFVADAETGAPVGSGGGVSVSYSAAAGGSNVGTIITITGLNVPEPTTATLSLLALAALAARRRRNA